MNAQLFPKPEKTMEMEMLADDFADERMQNQMLVVDHLGTVPE